MSNNLIGQQFGELTVVELFSKGIKGNIWKCICTCGEYRIVYGYKLKNGSVSKCPTCVKRERYGGVSLDEKLDHFTLPIPESGCHIWTGLLHRETGIPILSFNRKQLFVRQIICKSKYPNMDLSKRQIQCSCGIKECVNPDHLFLANDPALFVCPLCGCYKDKRATVCNKCRFDYYVHPLEGTGKDWHVNENGYTVKYISGEYVYQHRWVMEQLLGRKLESYEHIHHKDGNKLNNNIENLEIIDAREHGRIHLTRERAKEMSKLGHERRWGYVSN